VVGMVELGEPPVGSSQLSLGGITANPEQCVRIVAHTVDNARVPPMGTIALSTMAFVLIMAGSAKLRIARRGLGALELAAGLTGLLAPPRAGASLAALMFASFAVVHLRSGEVDCGCLGSESPSRPARAATLTAATAALAVLLAVRPGPGLLAETPDRAATAVALGSLLALIWRAVFTAAPGAAGRAGGRLVDSSARFLEQRVSRRDALLRVATVGSALVVAPLRYLLYPISAMAAIVPGDCSSGLCTDGYTAFCCEINRGVNACPEGTFAGGWWKCTDYRGRRLCSEQGVRYYVDCNRIPGTHFPGGCHCANNSCANRRVACNVFRYGQCNPQVHGVTEVVCRMILCENPARIPHLNCNASLAVDNAVCGHDVPCLEPAAVELAGAGGV